MTESILTSIKKLLGISEDYTAFDIDIIIHINTVIATLKQMGVGNSSFRVIDKNNTWSEFIDNDNIYDMVKTYIYLKVRLIFDPPTSGGGLMDAMESTISELEWRLNSHADYGT